MADLSSAEVALELTDRYQLELEWLGDESPIAGSFWGAPEAGIVDGTVLVRNDTPVHSFLHETSHVICMAAGRRVMLTGDAGSDDLEECAVCYLQILLADTMQGVGRERLMADMNAWGYSFRLGSTECWFAEDAEDARADWLA